jgi:ribosomal protein S18 acetylase RimI-like enzyme
MKRAIEVRVYRTADFEAYARLLEGLQSYVMSLDDSTDLILRPGFGRKKARWNLAWVRSRSGQIFVAASSEVVVGCVSAGVVPLQGLEKQESHSVKPGHIGDLFVVPHCRGQGVGSALLRVAERYLRRKRCDRIRIWLETGNARARALYGSRGYKDVNLLMSKRVRPLRPAPVAAEA